MAVSKTVKVKNESGNVLKIEPDSYIGLLLGVVHIGTHKNEYKGEVSVVDQVLFQFELQDLITDKGNPIVVSKVLRNSMHPKSGLIKLAEAMGADIKKGVDFDNLIGKPLLVKMDYNQANTKVSIKGFTSLPSFNKNNVKPLMGTPRVFLDVDDITIEQKAEFPEWIRILIDERIRTVVDDNNTDDIPL